MLDTPAIVDGYNFQWAAVGLLGVVCFARTFLEARRAGDEVAMWFAAGALLEMQAIAFRMGFWWLAGELAPPGETYHPRFIDLRGWLLIPIQLGVLGMAFMLRGLLHRWLGRHWFATYTAAVAGLFLFGALH